MSSTFLLLSTAVAVGWGCEPAAATAEALGAAPPAFHVVGATGDPGAPGPAGAGDEPWKALAEKLRSPRPADRRRAVKALAADGSPPAWRILFTALADPESEVGDEAQLLLARVEDGSVAAELAGRAGLGHREPAVRRRAAEGLGRAACTVDAAWLLAALDDREGEVAHLALWSVERQTWARRLGGDLERAAAQLEHAGRAHREPWARAAAIAARAALFTRAPREDQERGLAEFLRLLQRAAEDRDVRVRCAAALGARALPAAAALPLLAPLAADGHWSVRLARVEALEALACKPAALALIAALDGEPYPRARREIAGSLQRLSGLKHRDDPRPWRDWASELPADWRPTLVPFQLEAGAGRPAADAGGEARTEVGVDFVGLPLHSQRVCFAIDFSGSMWMPMPDGRLPKELVDARLRSTLESLPPATEFNVVPFTNEALPWRPKLVPANPANVRAALADFERCQARGRGNFFDAAVFALDDPEVDTLLSLTDGVPTGGFHSDLDLVVPLLLERNRFRRVAFDTVLVDAPPAFARRWRILARDSGGRVVETDKAG